MITEVKVIRETTDEDVQITLPLSPAQAMELLPIYVAITNDPTAALFDAALQALPSALQMLRDKVWEIVQQEQATKQSIWRDGLDRKTIDEFLKVGMGESPE